MTVRLRTAEEKQVDSVTKALLHGTPDLVYLNSSICAACGISMLMKAGKNQTAYYVHGRFTNPAVQQCVNADKVFLAEAIKLEVIDPEDYERMGVDYVAPVLPVPSTGNGIGRKGIHRRHMGIDTAADGGIGHTVFRRIERRIRVKEDGVFEDEWVETGNFVLDKHQNLRYLETAMILRATNRPFTANAPQTHQGSGAART